MYNIALDDEKKLTFDNAVALIRYRRETNSLGQTFDLRQVLQGIPVNTKIPNKPKRSLGKISIEDSIRSKVFFEGGK